MLQLIKKGVHVEKLKLNATATRAVSLKPHTSGRITLHFDQPARYK